MDILRTCLPAIMVYLIVFAAPLFHAIVSAGEGVVRMWGHVWSADAAPAAA
jgi:hypothetical protein